MCGTLAAVVRVWIAVALVVGVLAGCGAERWAYTKPGLSPARLDQDLEACRRDAYRPHSWGITRSARIDQDALNQCMQRKGYSARRDE